MKNYKIKFLVFLSFSLLILISPPIFASSTDGTIDYTYRYAYGENVGFIDFGSTGGSIHITDDTLTGYAYGENIGFINLQGVINDKEGHLSGYAYGENIGFIDFSRVIIGTDGTFSGYAYGENIGFITFGTTTNKVITDWRPKNTRLPSFSSHSSSGSSVSTQYTNLISMGNTKQAEILKQQFPNQITSTTNTNSLSTQPIIIRILKYKMTGDDVKQLQIYLNTHNFKVSQTGVGSPNNETTYFGLKTKQAVINFQKANNLTPDGIVGALTRSKLK